jgi:hypothetical protein
MCWRRGGGIVETIETHKKNEGEPMPCQSGMCFV